MKDEVFAEVDTRQEDIDNAEAMNRLVANEDFTKLFSEIFINAFAITNTYNIGNYDDATRRRTMEKMIARSHFSNFIEDVIQSGRDAIISINEEASEDQTEESSY